MREAKRIIRALGDVDDRYIEETAPGKKVIKHLSWRKCACLVACLILMLSLSVVAYAANWFGIRDLLLPFINQSTSTEEEENIIGLSGYQGSAEWQALAEWQNFVSQYDPDGIIYQNTDGRLDSSFARYSCYLVYSQEMADQMDAITEKYELTLHTTSYDIQKHPELTGTLGDFLGDNGGYCTYMYEDGTFEVEGTIQFADTGAWDFVLLRSVKGTFHDAMLNIGDIAEYQEVKYFLWSVWCIIGAFLTPQWLTITFLNITGLIYKYDYTMDEGTAEILGIILLLMWVLIVLVPAVLFLKKMKYYGNKKRVYIISGFLISVILGIAVFKWDTVGFWIN